MAVSENAGIFTTDPVESKKTMTTEDAFDSFSNSVMSDIEKKTQEREAAATDNENETDDSVQNREDNTNVDEVTDKEEVPTFKPIKFAGDVLGDKVDIEIKSERELQAYLKRGHAAQGLYNDLQKLQTEIAPIQERAALMDTFDERIAKDPLSVVKMITSEHMDREQYLKFISDEYAYHHKLSNMSAEERAREEAIVNGQRAAAELARIEKEKASLIAQQEKQQEEAWMLSKSTWANDELRAWKNRLPPTLENLVKTTLISFADKADTMRAKGQKVDLKKLSSELKGILQPLVNSSSSDRSKIGKNAQARSNDATKIVQNSARNAMRGQANNQTNANTKYDSADIWDTAAQRAAAGGLKLRP